MSARTSDVLLLSDAACRHLGESEILPSEQITKMSIDFLSASGYCAVSTELRAEMSTSQNLQRGEFSSDQHESLISDIRVAVQTCDIEAVTILLNKSLPRVRVADKVKLCILVEQLCLGLQVRLPHSLQWKLEMLRASKQIRAGSCEQAIETLGAFAAARSSVPDDLRPSLHQLMSWAVSANPSKAADDEVDLISTLQSTALQELLLAINVHAGHQAGYALPAAISAACVPDAPAASRPAALAKELAVLPGPAFHQHSLEAANKDWESADQLLVG